MQCKCTWFSPIKNKLLLRTHHTFLSLGNLVRLSVIKSESCIYIYVNVYSKSISNLYCVKHLIVLSWEMTDPLCITEKGENRSLHCILFN